MENFWRKLDKPIKVLAPMAGYTDSAFRQLCRELGADVVVTELISADAIFHQSKNWFRDGDNIWKSRAGRDETLQMLQFAESERPILVQLFGKFPEKFAFAADWVTKNIKPEGIDINMGCPARKVVNSDHGAALLKNPQLAAEIVRAVKGNSDLPVSVKTRLGWDSDDQILEFAPKLVEAGIDAITIHGRTYKDGFKGKARWENIFEVKKLFVDRLVVIGNGDIQESGVRIQKSGARSQDSEVRIKDSGVDLDGFAIGRAAVGKPWIFSKDEITPEDLKKIILRHASLTFAAKGQFGLVEFRKHLLLYLRGFAGAKDLRVKAVAIENLEDVVEILDQINI
ncbi:MAG: tRNA-dihydrouridine synthase family protein [Candidatus Berkelbacteria bacterium]|nr:tRNA-dihydrouridine synthase family protein [Candidatus Berkelbacteria bacterium]